MSDKEREKFLVEFGKLGAKLAKDPIAAKQILINAGIITPKGNLRKPYKNLCTQRDPV
jgi:hypothetical protein